MNALSKKGAAVLAFVSLGTFVATNAAAQNVVVQPPPAPAPAPAPAPVQAAPAPVVVAPQASAATVPAEGSTSMQAPAEEPPSYVRPNRALLMSGLIAFGVPYIASLGVAATSPHAGDSDLWIPAIGPWLDVGQRGGCPSNNDCGGETGNKVLLVGDGILQSIGALQIVGAFVFPERHTLAPVVTTGSGSTMTFSPSKVGSTGYGLSAAGNF